MQIGRKDNLNASIKEKLHVPRKNYSILNSLTQGQFGTHFKKRAFSQTDSARFWRLMKKD